MGVHGLWDLLAPVGRRLSVENLAGKKLAIDASIWIIQFMKAMRDERGEMVKNAHLIGFFRRICKLLFLRTKPVFVFDGGTPALKRRTVIARRRQRENAQAKIRKTAEKLLLNHLKKRKLEELAKEFAVGRKKIGAKGKGVVTEPSKLVAEEEKEGVKEAYNQDNADALLAASLAAEEDGAFISEASTSAAGVPIEEEDNLDESEEMIFPTGQGKVDPAILAALPPSMQLDLLVQMREQLMAENRQKYQKVKKAPSKFSELQIHSYLKTVAFRREINEVQKFAGGRGVGGLPASRIASESNREFIFSSSYSGDKNVLSTSGVSSSGDTEHQLQGTNSKFQPVESIPSTIGFSSNTRAAIDESERELDGAVETYLDERGRVRVSRLRGMGIRMTRDLQWNLEMMKELEQVKSTETNNMVGLVATTDDEVAKGAPSSICPKKASSLKENNERDLFEGRNGDSIQMDENNLLHTCSTLGGTHAIEISFSEDEFVGHGKDEDEFFTSLVAENTASMEESHPSQVEASNGSDEGEVDWEDGTCDLPVETSNSPIETKQTVSKGSLAEEAEIQEAIRRSLQENSGGKCINLFSEVETPKPSIQRFDICKESNKIISSEDGEHKIDGNSVLLDFPLTGSQFEASLHTRMGSEQDGIKHQIAGPVLSDAYQDQKLQSHKNCSIMQDELVVDFRKQEIVSELEGPPNVNSDVPAIMASNVFDAFSGDTPLNNLHHSLSSQHHCDIENAPVDIKEFSSKEKGLSDDIKDREISAKEADLDLKISSSKEKELSDDAKETEVNAVEVDLLADQEDYHKDVNEFQDRMEFQDTLDEEISLLRQEQLDLGDQQRKLERNAEYASSEMFAECQELLQMFGLPYIIAPMEAEAQCAYMELSNLVDGVVTDDSDAFLFGARSIYKNIFDDRKYVEMYLIKDVENELGLTRDKLIRMALLLGSDYTEGISGVGIVNAIEIVNAFPEEGGLQKFREWLESPDPSILNKVHAQTGKETRKKSSKESKKDEDVCESMGDVLLDDNSDGRCNIDQESEDIANLKQIFMEKHRNVSKNWCIPSSFPSESVLSAYKSPQVDESTEPFLWGKPDLLFLRKLCWERFGWPSQKADELLLPVLREHNRHETQLRLEAFYTFNEKFAKIRSKRIQKAVKGITGNRSSEMMHVPGSKEASTSSEPKRRKGKSPPNSNEDAFAEVLNNDTFVEGNDEECTGNQVSKQQRKQRTTTREKARRERGNGKGRGRGRGMKGGYNAKPSETSSCDGEECNEKTRFGQMELPVLRRSARPKKNVKYAGAGDSLNQSDSDYIAEVGHERDPSSCGGIVGAIHSINHEVAVENVDGSSSKDYLSMGGGFCPEEAEPRSDLDEPVLGCVDTIIANNSNKSRSRELLDEAFGAAQTWDHEPILHGRSVSEVQPANANGPQQEDFQDKDEEERNQTNDNPNFQALEKSKSQQPETGLKAMPTLRRKRKM
ncbi:DNA repair protein UVH3 isoform X1 [Amborella trichopoda]|uniref:DNA repair protein UVH3 n=1 Tax=Amborella trichopoda TaxID=13333 RepID=W1PK18_AMBTC|nr:DNA repair protein UVH3 isoform X1 [Amborella trichopoda]ERN10327.1 hypothetical protein AMTR_s00026p00019230 [Amborella trichopoda]|eukprot:XP_006848746.1 DNA repair protein UVH3 isoform X1 [Amborella trichopoda]